ncbi:MAG: polyphosphate glucokinase [Marinilabiliales bacterium]|nr:MAG: polyphosphate glucokinase [Marinilabiliales bacterium]
MDVLGIDIGGSGIKGTIVNLKTGEFVSDRYRIETPQPATPELIATSIHAVAKHFNWKDKIGCGFPAVIQNGVIKTASNIDNSCIGVNANKLFSKKTGCKVKVYNDADVAGYAELKFGKVKDFNGLTIFLTIGTGIGTALFYQGQLIPNTEFGHVFMNNKLIAEHYASDAIRKKEDLSWKAWGKRFNEYLEYLEKLINPELIILGGGTSKKFEKFSAQINIKTPIEPAQLLNNAGIIGAALLA